MYHVGLKPKKQTKHHLWISGSFIVLAVVIGLVYIGLRSLNPKTTIQQSQAVVTKVTASSQTSKRFETPNFILELPTDWKELPRTTSPYTLFRFQSLAKGTASRTVDVYQDTIPTQYPLNRVLAVEAAGDHLQVNGTMSENCAEFTKGPSQPYGAGTLAKWQNVDFLCDLAKYQRNVVGTSSLGSINSVSFKTDTGATRKYFFVYTDNGINPNYANFLTALNSFRIR